MNVVAHAITPSATTAEAVTKVPYTAAITIVIISEESLVRYMASGNNKLAFKKSRPYRLAKPARTNIWGRVYK